MLKKLLKNESTSLILVLIGIFFLGFAVITFLWLDIEFDTETRIKSEKFVQFGDFI